MHGFFGSARGYASRVRRRALKALTEDEGRAVRHRGIEYRCVHPHARCSQSSIRPSPKRRRWRRQQQGSGACIVGRRRAKSIGNVPHGGPRSLDRLVYQ